jgi:succinyl-diaminopimelate desuccinylase
LVGTFGRESGAGAIRLIRKKLLNPKAVLAGAPTGLRIANRAPGFAKVEISLPLAPHEKKYLEQHNQLEGSHSQSKIFSRQSSMASGRSIHDNPIIKMIDYLKNMPSGMAILSVDGGSSAEAVPEMVELEVDLMDSLEGGVSAKLIQLGESLKKMAAELMSVRDENFLPPYSTINLGTIRMHPEEVILSGVCSLVPAADRTTYEKWLDRLRAECTLAGAEFKIVDFKPPLYVNGESTFFNLLKKTAQKCATNDQFVAAKYCTEANIFQRMGVESAVFGPGEAPDLEAMAFEHVSMSQIHGAIQFYRHVIENFERQ